MQNASNELYMTRSASLGQTSNMLRCLIILKSRQRRRPVGDLSKCHQHRILCFVLIKIPSPNPQYQLLLRDAGSIAGLERDCDCSLLKLRPSQAPMC